MASSEKTGDSSLKDSLIPEEHKKDEVKISEVKSLKDLCLWFIKDPISRWPLVFFLVSFVSIILWLIIYLAAGNGGYVIAGIAGCSTAAYGFNHFRILMALREQVDVFAKQNKLFKCENMAVVKEVNKLEQASIQLRTMESTLRESTEKQKENLHNLNQLNQNLSTLGGVNNDAMNRLQDMSKKMASQWKTQLVKHERDLLFSVYEQHEFKDNQAGLQEDEYRQFLEALPLKYQQRFHKMGTFKELAGDDGILDSEEFKSILDKMSEQEIEQ